MDHVIFWQSGLAHFTYSCLSVAFKGISAIFSLLTIFFADIVSEETSDFWLAIYILTNSVLMIEGIPMII